MIVFKDFIDAALEWLDTGKLAALDPLERDCFYDYGDGDKACVIGACFKKHGIEVPPDANATRIVAVETDPNMGHLHAKHRISLSAEELAELGDLQAMHDSVCAVDGDLRELRLNALKERLEALRA